MDVTFEFIHLSSLTTLIALASYVEENAPGHTALITRCLSNFPKTVSEDEAKREYLQEITLLAEGPNLRIIEFNDDKMMQVRVVSAANCCIRWTLVTFDFS